MAGLADDWPENRQTCIDVLCAYLRLPYEPDPGNGAPESEQLAFRASQTSALLSLSATTGSSLATAWVPASDRTAPIRVAGRPGAASAAKDHWRDAQTHLEGDTKPLRGSACL
jgi:hypothetical protein